MKTTIKVKLLNKNCKPLISKKGDWIDLRAAENSIMHAPSVVLKDTSKDSEKEKITISKNVTKELKIETKLIPLGVAIKLPKGLEAVVVVRSGAYKHYKVILLNSFGVIDNSYCGDRDEWKANIAALENSVITVGDRICQFKVQLSQFATPWQKLKWMFSSGIKIKYVKKLGNKNRGGFGHSGKK